MDNQPRIATVNIFIMFPEHSKKYVSNSSNTKRFRVSGCCFQAYTLIPDERVAMHDDIYPDCTYQMLLKSPNGTVLLDVVYTVPECVGPVCNCKKRSPKVALESVEVADTNTLLINWRYLSELYNNISNIRFT